MASNSRWSSRDEVDESIEMGLFLVGFSGFSACIFPGWTTCHKPPLGQIGLKFHRIFKIFFGAGFKNIVLTQEEDEV